MMTSITPVGEISRRQRWSVTTAAHLVGSTLGGAAVGAALGLLSVPVRAVLPQAGALAVLGVGALVGLALDRRGGLPTVRRQVDEQWLTRYRGWVYGFGFGLQLGAAVVTIVTSSATYVVLLAALLSGSIAAGALVGGVFGLVRALPVLAFRRVRSPGALHDAMRRMTELARPADKAVAGVQLVVASAAIGVAVAGVA